MKQVDEKFGKIEKEMDEMKKENEGLKDGMAKLMKTFDELKKENGKLKGNMQDLKERIKKVTLSNII